MQRQNYLNLGKIGKSVRLSTKLGYLGLKQCINHFTYFFLSIICEAEIHYDVPCQARSSLSKISHNS